MQNKTALLISVILLVLLMFWHFSSSNQVEITEETITIVEDIVSPQDDLKEKISQADRIMNLVEKNQISDDLIEQVHQQPLSPIMLMKTHRFCYRYFSSLKSKNNQYDVLERFNEKLNDLQRQYFADYYDYCEQLNIEQPEYHLTDLNKIQKQITDKQDDSLWNQIVLGDIDAESLSSQEIEGLITQNNLEILTQAPELLRTYYEEVIHWGIEDILQNHQYDYVNYVLKSAHQLYLCDIGADCTAQSSTMAMFCFITSESCGLEFPVFVETVLTSGQQQDIIIAYNYLLKKYNPSHYSNL